MVNFNELRDRILSAIQSNGDQEITGDILQDQLIGIVNAVEEIAQGFSELDGKNERLQTAIDSQSEMIEDLQDMKIDKEADDYYPDISVGTADNLSGEEVVASDFSMRQSGGGAIADGVARIQALKGNSIIWNQQSSGITIEGDIAISLPMGARVVKGHKYILLCDAQENNPSLYLYGYLPGKSPEIIASLRGSTSTFFVSQISLEATSVANTEGGLWWYQAGNANSKTIRPRLINLTQMFGQGNEPTTIEDFYQRIPVGVNLYAYNSGVTINFFADGIKSVGRNLYDGEKARLIGGKTYYLNGIYKSLMFNGESLTLPGNRLFTPSISGEIEAEGEGICINLSDSEFNGAYEEYIESIQDLTMLRKYFPNGLRSVDGIYDEIRFSKTIEKWEKVQRVGEDGKALAEPIVTPINEKFNLDYKVENGGTEEIISTSPSSAMRADIAYGFNAVGLIKQLRSMIEALSAKVANL